MGEDKGILLGGQPVATMSMPHEMRHLRREDLVHVAPGMDILLALGVNFIRYDKYQQDVKDAVA